MIPKRPLLSYLRDSLNVRLTATAAAVAEVPKVAANTKPATDANGFEDLSAEQTANVGKACSLDDPDCIACSA